MWGIRIAWNGCSKKETDEAGAGKRTRFNQNSEKRGIIPAQIEGLPSPEDESEDVYTILEEKVGNDALEELVIQCNKCSSRIHLIGFPTFEMENL